LNRDEFSRIAECYLDTVYRVALSCCRNAADADDIVQDVFLKLLNTTTEFTDEEHIRKWLIRVTVNAGHDLWRSPWRVHTSPLDELTEEPVFQSPERSALFEAVMDLPVKYRSVIHLFYYEGYKTKEIAEILGIREAAVRTRLKRARGLLKEQLNGEWQ